MAPRSEYSKWISIRCNFDCPRHMRSPSVCLMESPSFRVICCPKLTNAANCHLHGKWIRPRVEWREWVRFVLKGTCQANASCWNEILTIGKRTAMVGHCRSLTKSSYISFQPKMVKRYVSN